MGGGANNAGYDGRRRHAAQGAERAAEADGGGGVGDVRVDGVMCQ